MSLTPRGDDFGVRSSLSFDHMYTPRPSSAPSRSTTPREYGSPQNREYEWNKSRNPITGTGDFSTPSKGKKQIPSYYETIQSGNNRTRGKAKMQDIDISRAGIPTFIQRIRIREGDIYHKRPSTAPSPTTTTSTDSPLYPTPPSFYNTTNNITDANTTTTTIPTTPDSPTKARGRKPCPIPHLSVRRNPLIENDDVQQKHRPMSKSNFESNSEATQTVKKTNLQHVTHQTRPGFIPMDEPTPPPVKLRPFVPDDNEDVFYYRHAQGICPPDRTVLTQRENEKAQQETRLQQAQKDRKVELDDQIKKHKQRMERYQNRKNGVV